MRYRSATLLLAAGAGVILLAVSTGRTERPEWRYDLQYVSVEGEDRTDVRTLAGGPY